MIRINVDDDATALCNAYAIRYGNMEKGCTYIAFYRIKKVTIPIERRGRTIVVGANKKRCRFQPCRAFASIAL